MTGNLRRWSAAAAVFILLAADATPTQQPAMITGRVTDAESGAPLRGALIAGISQGQAIARTGPDGTFSAPMPSLPSPNLSLTVSKPGYVRVQLQASSFASGRVDVSMPRGSVVVAYVVDEQGRPVPRVSVSVLCPRAVSGAVSSQRTQIAASASRPTDDRGEARVSGLPPGRCTVRTARGQQIVRVGPTVSPAELQRVSEILREQLLAQLRQRAQVAPPQLAGVDVDLFVGRETVIVIGEMSNQPLISVEPLPAGIGVPAATGTGAVRGRVLLGNGQPAVDVLVQMTGAGSNRAVVTNAAGEYQFTALPAGRFQLGVSPTVQLVGLVPAAPPGVIDLADGQGLTADLRVTRLSTLSGTVLDEFGEPAEDVPVRVIRAAAGLSAPSAGGALGAAPSQRTDDRGRFRVSVSPGTYRVAALISAVGQREEPVYFPGTVHAAEAGEVDVLPELETSGIEIMTTRTAGVTLRGTVVDAGGRPVERGVVVLADKPGTAPLGNRTQVPFVAGVFEFLSVREGEYDLLLSAPPAPYLILSHRNGQPVDSTVPPLTEFAYASVTIARAPVALALQTAPPSVLRGRVVLEGDVGDLSPAAVRFAPLDVRVQVSPVGVADDWSFRVSDLITTTRIGLSSAPSGWWLKSFVVNGVDAAAQPVDFSGGRQSSDRVRAVLARTSRLSGRVSTTGDAPVRGIVAVFPLDTGRRYARSPFVRTAAIDANGSYTVAVPPGQYFVAAVTSLGSLAAVASANLPPQLAAALGLSASIGETTMLQLEAVSVLVSVGESAEARQDLRLASVP